MSGVVTLGETLALAASSTPGSLVHAATLDLSIGGAESNVAIGVRRLGGEAAWIGRVGQDPFGVRVVRELRADDVDVHVVIDESVPTALMVKERRTDESGRVWYYRENSAGSRLCPADLPLDVIRAADVVHLTGITPGLSDSARAATRATLETVAEARVPLSFDVNHRLGVWRDTDPVPVYRDIAAAASVVFAGEEEARLLTGSDSADPDALLDALAEMTPGSAVLKLGAAGCCAVIEGERHHVPAVPVTVVDTVGAGDAFVAGYLAEMLRGLGARERLHTAVRCGAIACASTGDWEGLPTRADLQAHGGADPVRR